MASAATSQIAGAASLLEIAGAAVPRATTSDGHSAPRRSVISSSSHYRTRTQSQICHCRHAAVATSRTSRTFSARDSGSLSSRFSAAFGDGATADLRHAADGAEPGYGESKLSLRRSTKRQAGIKMALSKEKKDLTVEKLKSELENCFLLAALDYTGLSVKQMQNLRKALPETTRLLIVKNTLMRKTVEDDSKWNSVVPHLQGMNAWLFVHTEELPAALKPFRDLQKEAKLTTDYTIAVFEGKAYAKEEVKFLETLPSREELYCNLILALKAPAARLVSVLKGPSIQLILVLRAYIDKLEKEQEAAAAEAGGAGGAVVDVTAEIKS